MHLRTYIAPSLKTAKQRILEELGPDAIVVAALDRPEGGYEVRAAIERERLNDFRNENQRRNSRREEETMPESSFPQARAFYDLLIRAGVEAPLADTLTATADGVSASPQRRLQSALSRKIRRPFSDVSGGQTMILVGPPGVGKSIAVARLALRALRAGLKINWVTLDGRAGAAEQSQTLARRMKLKVYADPDPDRVVDALAQRSRDDRGSVCLIDTPAIGPYRDKNDENRILLDRLLSGVAPLDGVEIMPTLSVACDPELARDCLAVVKSAGPQRFIATQLDLTARPGRLLNLIHKLSLDPAYLSVAPWLGEGFAAARLDRLADLIIPPQPEPSPPRPSSPGDGRDDLQDEDPCRRQAVKDQTQIRSDQPMPSCSIPSVPPPPAELTTAPQRHE